jgi:signal transduction histidine kinase
MERIVDRSKWFFHPIFVFVFSIVALAMSLALYIYWYVGVSAGLKEVIQTFNLDSQKIFALDTWVVILVLSILVGVILVGIFIIFFYNMKLIRLYRMQNNFINNFTHELKTPVTSLSLYLETFIKHPLSRSDQIKYLEYMVADIKRLSENVNRILNIAKIESRNYVGEFIVVDLVAAVKQFLASNRQLFKQCDITVHYPPKASFPYRINASLFDMLLMNLLTNAVKYNESEKPTIEIMFERKNRRLHISFKDNGVGIKKAETKKIFRKFYQSGHSDDMSAIGSGLGLHLVQNIARIHKGKVVAESKGPNMGSVFTLMLPFNNLVVTT